MPPIPVRHIELRNETQLNPGKFSIRPVEQVLNGKDLMHDLHRHDFFFILVLQKGSGIHEIDFVQYEVYDHTIFIVRPGQVHRLELKAGARGFLMEFEPGFYQPASSITAQRWQKASGKTFCKVEEEKFIKINAILSAVLEESVTQNEGYAEAIVSNLDLFFIEYSRQSDYPKKNTQPGMDYMQERYAELLRLLEKNIAHKKSVADYAKLLSLSIYQLNAITKTVIGKTVSECINEQIILEAKRYLLATAGQVKDIADHLGYEDASYFTRFFKKQTGHSPDAFRKNFK